MTGTAPDRLVPAACRPAQRCALAAAVLVAALSGPAWGQLSGNHAPREQRASERQAAAAAAAVDVVKGFISAGESNDVAARAAYLAPQVFFYGRTRTRSQASRQLSILYRVWPQRKFTATSQIEVFAIPHHAGAYQVRAVIEYQMVSRENERRSGKSRITCVVTQDRNGVRIVGVDEQLLSGTTNTYPSR
ncbi:MAG: hypothetical protein JO069_11995 [Verrucomicrobia bacterium]|nr:hypothetical protein [Verrucomicrobiota bacterium]